MHYGHVCRGGPLPEHDWDDGPDASIPRVEPPEPHPERHGSACAATAPRDGSRALVALIGSLFVPLFARARRRTRTMKR